MFLDLSCIELGWSQSLVPAGAVSCGHLNSLTSTCRHHLQKGRALPASHVTVQPPPPLACGHCRPDPMVFLFATCSWPLLKRRSIGVFYLSFKFVGRVPGCGVFALSGSSILCCVAFCSTETPGLLHPLLCRLRVGPSRCAQGSCLGRSGQLARCWQAVVDRATRGRGSEIWVWVCL